MIKRSKVRKMRRSLIKNPKKKSKKKRRKKKVTRNPLILKPRTKEQNGKNSYLMRITIQSQRVS